MSSKLKRKAQKPKKEMKFSNQELQARSSGLKYDIGLITKNIDEAYNLGFKAGREQGASEGFDTGYAKGFESGKEKGFDDGMEYSNLISAICNSVALNLKFKFGSDRLIKMFERSNEVLKEINADKKNVWKYIKYLENKKLLFDDEDKKFLEKVM